MPRHNWVCHMFVTDTSQCLLHVLVTREYNGETCMSYLVKIILSLVPVHQGKHMWLRP